MTQETKDDDAPLMIRRAPNACCPDCHIHNGYCYEMHEFILKEARQQTAQEILKLIKEKKEYYKYWESDIPLDDLTKEIKQKYTGDED